MMSVRQFNAETRKAEKLAAVSGNDIRDLGRAAREYYRTGRKAFALHILQMMAIGAYEALSKPKTADR